MTPIKKEFSFEHDVAWHNSTHKSMRNSNFSKQRTSPSVASQCLLPFDNEQSCQMQPQDEI